MKAKTNLYHRWLLKYFFQMAISLGIIVIVYLIGYIVCKRRIWYPDDAWYCDLNWIDDHTFVVIFFLMLVCSVFFAVRMLKKIAFGVSEIGDAIVEIDSEKKDPIVLSGKNSECRKYPVGKRSEPEKKRYDHVYGT